jgi:transcriptional regulator with XRE-family HTH domain
VIRFGDWPPGRQLDGRTVSISSAHPIYELRHAEAVSQVELAGRLDVTQGAISKLEHSEDARVATLRQHLEALRRSVCGQVSLPAR